MKNVYPILLFLLSFNLVQAQAPQAFSYQAVARDASNNAIVNQEISLQVSILDGTVDGLPIYVETHTAQTNDIGLFALEIGRGTPTMGVFSDIKWGINNRFLKVEMDRNGGTNYELVGTSQFLSVPYALYAENVNPESVSKFFDYRFRLRGRETEIRFFTKGSSAGFRVISFYLGGDDELIEYSVEGLPDGVNPNTPRIFPLGEETDFSYNLGCDVVPGNYPITIIGKSLKTNVIRTQTYNLIIENFPRLNFERVGFILSSPPSDNRCDFIGSSGNQNIIPSITENPEDTNQFKIMNFEILQSSGDPRFIYVIDNLTFNQTPNCAEITFPIQPSKILVYLRNNDLAITFLRSVDVTLSGSGFLQVTNLGDRFQGFGEIDIDGFDECLDKIEIVFDVLK